MCVYCMVMAINGGIIGAFGPALHAFARATGLSHAALGTGVLQNRLAKLVGAVFWGVYADRLQRSEGRGTPMALKPHTVLATSLLLTAVASCVIGCTTNGVSFQLAMTSVGFCYGVTDSAMQLLVLWTWQHDAHRQRVNVALANAMFTVGAFLSPMLVAASLHCMHGSAWPAFTCLGAISLVTAIPPVTLLASPSPPREHEVVELAAIEHSEEMYSESEPSATPMKQLPANGGEVWSGDGGDGGETEREPLFRRARLRCTRERAVLVTICTMCFFANGAEHTVATWLPPYGTKACGLSESTMAIMTSNFWTTMSLGRVAWASFSGLIPSAWPALFANTIVCVASSALFFSTAQGLVWGGALGIGAGISFSFPAAITLPPEIGIEMTPRSLMTLQFCASFGEMFCPFVVGVLFQWERHDLFGPLLFSSHIVVLLVLTMGWAYLSRRPAGNRASAPAVVIPIDEVDEVSHRLVSPPIATP